MRGTRKARQTVACRIRVIDFPLGFVLSSETMHELKCRDLSTQHEFVLHVFAALIVYCLAHFAEIFVARSQLRAVCAVTSPFLTPAVIATAMATPAIATTVDSTAVTAVCWTARAPACRCRCRSLCCALCTQSAAVRTRTVTMARSRRTAWRRPCRICPRAPMLLQSSTCPHRSLHRLRRSPCLRHLQRRLVQPART